MKVKTKVQQANLSSALAYKSPQQDPEEVEGSEAQRTSGRDGSTVQPPERRDKQRASKRTKIRIIDQRGKRANRIPSKTKIPEQDVELHDILLDLHAAHPHWEAGRSSSHASPKPELKHRASLYYG